MKFSAVGMLSFVIPAGVVSALDCSAKHDFDLVGIYGTVDQVCVLACSFPVWWLSKRSCTLRLQCLLCSACSNIQLPSFTDVSDSEIT
jgi:hypothetical protein